MASPWVVGVKIAKRKLKLIRDKSRGVEKLLKDSFSRYTPQAHGDRCSFHQGVYLGYRIQGTISFD